VSDDVTNMSFDTKTASAELKNGAGSTSGRV
jgi:hypothetical protein